MAQKVDPDSIRKGSQPVTKGAASAKAGSRVPPPPPGKQAANRRTQRDEADDDEDEAVRPAPQAFRGEVPAWGISMLFHIVALLLMALVVGETILMEKPAIITSTPTVEEEDFTEVEVATPGAPESTDEPTPDVSVAAEVIVEPVTVSMADEVEAAPLAVELVEFGDQSAPTGDILSTLGAVGGKAAGGLGGRANAGKMAAGGGGGGATESAVDRALKWFAAHQLPDGSWSFNLEQCPSCAGKCSHAGKDGRAERGGATAMALLPFLGRGYTHREGPYKKQVEGGIAFLVQLAMKQNGKAYENGGNLYSQGLAGIAMSECYAMSQDERLAAPTQAVLNYIMEAQDPTGGGWRYNPRQAGDTSATGWQIMALKSGNMAYLNINPVSVKKAVAFLDSVQGDEYGGTYGYASPGKTHSTTAVGLLCRMYLGWKKDHPGIQEGAAYLAKHGPTDNLYYSYYATQVMHHMEGDLWKAWNEKMKKLLLESQSTKDHEAGSWYEGVDGGGHGVVQAGRLYTTSLATMMLEVYYRHMPMYRNEVADDEFRE